MGMVRAGLEHNIRMLEGVTNVERAALLRPLSEDDETKKVTLIRLMIARRRSDMGQPVINDERPGLEPDFAMLLAYFFMGSISTALLILGAWLAFG